MPAVEAEVIESLRLVPVDTVIRARSSTALDALYIGEVLTPFFGAVLTERLRLRETVVGVASQRVTLTETIHFVDQLYRAAVAELEDGLGFEFTLDTQIAFQIIERLRISEALVGNGTYHVVLTQAMRLLTSLANFYGADMIDGLAFAETMVSKELARATITDGFEIEPVLAPQFLLNVKLTDRIDIDPVEAINMLFQPHLQEGVEFEAGYLAPNGSFTTWVMNARTGAVTEYDNFVFNSFAPMGSRYLGAADDGLYELLGDDDDGDDIVARIRGGYLQFGGTQLSRLKEAYLAARGEGDWVLRIITGDGMTYNYAVSNRSMRSTKVHMGKGQRARYFAYELVSTGQDFDLDTLEFVPIVVQRRV